MKQFPHVTIRVVIYCLCAAASFPLTGCAVISLAASTASVAGTVLSTGVAVGGAAVSVASTAAKGMAYLGSAAVEKDEKEAKMEMITSEDGKTSEDGN